jgi:hypothetical protein
VNNSHSLQAKKKIFGDKFLISHTSKFHSLRVKISEVARPAYKLKAGIVTPLQASYATKLT